MLIFEIIPSLIPINGAENFVLSLSKKMVLKGNKVVIVSLYDAKNDFIMDYLAKNNIKIIFLRKKRGVDILCAKELKKCIRKYKPDVCHLHLDTYLTFYLSGAYRYQPNFYTFHTFIDNSVIGSINKPRNRFLQTLLKRKILVPVAISSIIKKSSESYFNIPNIPSVNNGVDLSAFTNCINAKKQFTFISVGRITDLKNNQFMLECFKKVSDIYNGLSYVVIGEGECLTSCKEYCKSNNLSNVIFTGRVNNVNDFLEKSECLLLASKYEGNPIVVNEAIASGVWVIANNVGGVPDIVNSNNGYLANFKEEQTFLECMKMYLKNKNEIETIIKKNIENNRKSVSIDKSCSDYLDLFYSALSAK